MGDLYPKLDKEELCDSDVDVTENESDNEKKAVISPSKRAPINRDRKIIQVELLPKSEKNKAKKKETVCDLGTLIIVGVVMAIFSAVAVGGYFFWPKTLPLETEIQGLNLVKVRKNFEVSLSNLKSVFKSQAKETWVRIGTVVRMTTSSLEPQSPGVISLIPSQSAAETVHCLAKKLAEILSLAYNDTNVVLIDGKSIGSRGNVDQVKQVLESEIRKGLESDEHVVLLLNFDKIPAKSGMLLHGLCDNDNAPFKQAVFILMVSGNNHPNVSNDGLDAEVTAAWAKDLPEEERLSLEARIGNGIAVVLPESKETLAKIC